MPPIRLALPVLGLLLAAGCADLRDQMEDVTDRRDDGPRMVAFACDDGRDFIARFSGDREEVEVDTGERRYELNYEERDDGRRIYDNDNGVELRVDNDEAYLRIPGESDYEDCELS